MTKRDVVFSGMRPTGRLHIGNYWGALNNWVELQSKYSCIYSVVDWHMLTTGYDDTSKLQENVREMVLDWLAAGVDPEKSIVFKQSDVPEHAELALMLGMVTPLGWLENNPTWREQLQELAKTKTSNIAAKSSGLDSDEIREIFRQILHICAQIVEQGFTHQQLFKEVVSSRFALSTVPSDPQGIAVVEVGAFIDAIEAELGKDTIETQVRRESNPIFQDLWKKLQERFKHNFSNWPISKHVFLDLVREAMKERNEISRRQQLIRTFGFLGYPVLQAADILLYHGTKVPVGEDQLPHLELSRQIAHKFNHYFGEVFADPQPLLTPAPKVPGSDGRKMSKSYGNTVDIYESAESLKKKIMSMYTDPTRIKKDDPGHPEPCEENPPGCTVFALHKLYADDVFVQERRRVCIAGQIGCAACKKDLLSEMEKPFADFRARREKYAADPKLIDNVLKDGAEKARKIAHETMKEVKKAMRLSS